MSKDYGHGDKDDGWARAPAEDESNYTPVAFSITEDNVTIADTMFDNEVNTERMVVMEHGQLLAIAAALASHPIVIKINEAVAIRALNETQMARGAHRYGIAGTGGVVMTRVAVAILATLSLSGCVGLLVLLQ